MSRAIVLRPKAEKAIDRAAGWYEARNARAAREFIHAIDHALEKVAENPGQFPLIRPGLRRAVVSGFPYSLLFRAKESEVVVTTCVHFPPPPTALVDRLIGDELGRRDENEGSRRSSAGALGFFVEARW